MSNEADYSRVCPFWIDTPSYTQRDKEMFVAGYEFCQILDKIREDWHARAWTIHRENESRIRMACGKFGRKCSIEPCEADHDPDGTWSYLTIEAKEPTEGKS